MVLVLKENAICDVLCSQQIAKLLGSEAMKIRETSCAFSVLCLYAQDAFPVGYLLLFNPDQSGREIGLMYKINSYKGLQSLLIQESDLFYRN